MLLLAICALWLGVSGCAPRAAFPGAEGHGALAVGGRGGSVIHVTRLDDNQVSDPLIPGTLRWALHQPSPKTIVFDVGGTIQLQDSIDVPRDRCGQTTIAGQTAPGGITICGAIQFLGSTFDEPASDFIMRHVRFRDRDNRPAKGQHPANSPTRKGDCISFLHGDRVILDHCSFSGSAGDLVDLSGTKNWTVQWCTFEEPAVQSTSDSPRDAGGHNRGLRFDQARKWSLLHCLVADIASETSGDSKDRPESGELVNCVVFNFRDGGSAILASRTANLIGNTWKYGPSDRRANAGAVPQGSLGSIFLADNQIVHPRDPHRDFAALEDPRQLWNIHGPDGDALPRFAMAEKPHPSTVEVTMHNGSEAYRLVLERAGAWPRDTTTRRMVWEVEQVRGIQNDDKTSEWANGPTSAANDTDRDGMPDLWEKAHGLNPKDTQDRNATAPAIAGKYAGYTNLEWYLNELADSRVPAHAEFVQLTTSAEGKGKVYSTIPGNTTVWHPSEDMKTGPFEVSRSFDSQMFHRGSWVGLKAIADPGSTFSGWRGGSVEGSQTPVVYVRLDQDAAITAIFEERLSDSEPEPELAHRTYEGAQGFGAISRGGRVDGGEDVHVTRMDDPVFDRAAWVAWKHLTPGTLRWAMHQPGPKKIIFDQPGTIRLWCPIQLTTNYNGPLSVPDRVNHMTFNETRQAITIIGTINIQGMNGADTVWLNTRFRAALWNNGHRPFQGGPQSTGDCLLLAGAGNCLIDHCEFSGGADEMFNYVQGTGNLTIQWSVFCEAFRNGDFGMKWGDDGAHNYGGLITFAAGADTGLTVHHCYLANLGKRMPTEVSSVPANPPPRFCEYINNTFYNWREFTGGFQAREAAWYQGNMWKFGPSATAKAMEGAIGYASPAYVADNRIQLGTTIHNLAGVHAPRGLHVLGDKPPTPWHAYPVSVQPQTEAIADTLDKAGVFPLDNLSKANRDAYTQGTGWQGAHPDWRTKKLDEYLDWATAPASY